MLRCGGRFFWLVVAESRQRCSRGNTTTRNFHPPLNLPPHPQRRNADGDAGPGRWSVAANFGSGRLWQKSLWLSRQHDQQRFCDEYPDQTETGCTYLRSASSNLGIGVIRSTVGCVALISGKHISAIDQKRVLPLWRLPGSTKIYGEVFVNCCFAIHGHGRSAILSQ